MNVYEVYLNDLSRKLNRQGILAMLKKFPYQRDLYWISYKAGLVLYGVFEGTNDIDLCCTKDLFDQLIKDGYKPIKAALNDTMKIILNERMEIFLEREERETNTIEGYQVEKLEYIAKLYKDMNRLKDQDTIARINAYQRKQHGVMESLVRNRKGGEYNLDNLQRKKGSNMIFITGNSGSGKTTQAKFLAEKMHGDVYSMDYFRNNQILYKYPKKYLDDDMKRVKKYVTKKYGKNGIDFDKPENNFDKAMLEYYDDLKREANRKSKIKIIEGTSIAREPILNKIKADNQPLYINKASIATSTGRAFKRGYDPEDSLAQNIKMGAGRLGVNMRIDHTLNKFIRENPGETF